MRIKLIPIGASFVMILSILACNFASGQTNNQPDLLATITAQAIALGAATITPQIPQSPSNTPAPTETPGLGSTQSPANTQGPSTPSKPRNFKTNGSAAMILFAWDDNSTNESGFRIYQDGVSAPVASINANPGTGGMSYNWPGLACGFKGKFSIRAYNDAGESASSNSADGVTIPCQPGNLTINASGNSLEFDWSVATSHNESGFRIYQQGVPQPVASRGPNLGSGGTIYGMSGLACNLLATFSVTAYNSAGESPPSNLVQSETVPCSPSGLIITSITKDDVQYSWNDNATNETGFHVYQDDALYLTLPVHTGTGTMASDAAQSCDIFHPVTHVYSIRAFNNVGESNSSEHIGATTPQCH